MFCFCYLAKVAILCQLYNLLLKNPIIFSTVDVKEPRKFDLRGSFTYVI